MLLLSLLPESTIRVKGLNAVSSRVTQGSFVCAVQEKMLSTLLRPKAFDSSATQYQMTAIK